jgi:F0F1-type ATP synthase gamma subunit
LTQSSGPANKNENKKRGKTTIIFYADNGFIGAYNPKVLQQTLDEFVTNLKQFGLQMSIGKSKTITLLGSKPVHQISSDAYSWQITKVGMTCEEKQQVPTRCEFCNEQIQKKSLKQHHHSKNCQNIQKKLSNQQEPVYCTPTTPILL